MSKNNNFTDFFTSGDFSKALEQYQSMSFDMKSLMDTQKKNMEALSKAQQLTIENLQAIAQKQSELVSQMVEDNSAFAKDIMTEGSPEEKIAKNAKLFKSMYERSVKNMKEISSMITKTNDDATDLINKRVTATMSEIESSLGKTQKKAAA